nr:MAG TPA: hypothetical protein [Caudoviricetes sp.]
MVLSVIRFVRTAGPRRSAGSRRSPRSWGCSGVAVWLGIGDALDLGCRAADSRSAWASSSSRVEPRSRPAGTFLDLETSSTHSACCFSAAASSIRFCRAAFSSRSFSTSLLPAFSASSNFRALALSSS